MRKLTDMNFNELKALYGKNKAFDEAVKDVITGYIDEQYKDDLYGINYTYAYGVERFSFLDDDGDTIKQIDIIEHLEKTQKEHEFFPADFYESTVKRFADLVRRMKDVICDLSEEDFNRLDWRIQELKYKIESFITKRMDEDFAWCGTADAFASYIKDMDGNEEFDNYYEYDGHIFKEIA